MQEDVEAAIVMVVSNSRNRLQQKLYGSASCDQTTAARTVFNRQCYIVQSGMDDQQEKIQVLIRVRPRVEKVWESRSLGKAGKPCAQEQLETTLFC